MARDSRADVSICCPTVRVHAHDEHVAHVLGLPQRVGVPEVHHVKAAEGGPAGRTGSHCTSVHAVQSHEPAVGPDAHLTLLLRVRLLLSPARLLRSPARPRAAAFRRCRHCK